MTRIETVQVASDAKPHPQEEKSRELPFQLPELIVLGDARKLTRGNPNGRWGDGSFNPTRYKD